MPKNLIRLFYISFLFSCALFLLPACNVSKNLAPGETLLVKNRIVILNKKSMPIAERDKVHEDLGKIAVQKPNKRFLGFLPFRMWLYYSATRPKKKLTKFRQWIIDKVGEPPVLLDSTAAERSEKLMENYMFNYGYFYGDITDTTIIKKRRAKVTYTLTPGPAARIGQVTYQVSPYKTDSLVYNTRSYSFLKPGKRFDIAYLLKSERERIELLLRNHGFYYFNREYVTFHLDSVHSSTSKEQIVDIKVIINQPSDTSEHQQYRLNNFYIISDFATDIIKDTLKRDTIITGDSLEYHILAQKTIIRKNVWSDVMFLRRGMMYNRDRELRTLVRLSQLGVFKFISMDFVKAKSRIGNYLDCNVFLTPAKRQALIASGEANVSNEGLFGMAGSLSYKNKNLSKRADQFSFDVSAGVQLRFSKDKNVQLITTNVNVSSVYYLNRFLVPLRKKLFSKNTNPKTRLGAGYIFEHRYDFDRNANVVFLYQLHNFNLSFGYEWNENPLKRHIFNPITLTFYLLPRQGAEFLSRLNQNPILKSSFEEQVIIGPNYTFIYDNYKGSTDRKYMYFRSGIETAGNILEAGFKIANIGSKNDSIYYIFKKPFSQYFRIEGDWRNYFKIRQHGLFAIRTYMGIGVPYGNSYAMPFIKQFSVGGPNSLRGFLIREIGPGGYYDPLTWNDTLDIKRKNVSFFNQTGDIKLELNAEFRFDIYKWFKGAVFIDAGNVWTLRKDTRLNGNFAFNRFWKEFAVDAGAGIRLDFNFFVIRFDYGFPLRDPRKREENRWLFENNQFRRGQFQLAIGYPF